MTYIRTKKIKGNHYAYLVQSKWNKSGKQGRQRVKKYFGRVRELKQHDEPFRSLPEYESNKHIIQSLLTWELHLCGFHKEDHIMKHGDITVNLNDFTVDCKGVLKLNEGYLCTHTLKTLVNFKLIGHRDDYRLAKAFIDAGIRIPKDLFVAYWQSLIK